MRFSLQLFPETSKALLDEMDRMFPEVRYDPSMTDAEIRHALARRSVFLQLRDRQALAQKRVS